MVRIELLGALRVFLDDRVIDELSGLKAGLLLAFLARDPGKPHPREQLIDLFWPDLDLDAGRNNLSKACGLIRRALGQDRASESGILRSDRMCVRLDDGAVSTDLREFEVLVRKASGTDDADLQVPRSATVEFDSWTRVSRNVGPYIQSETLPARSIARVL